MQQVIKLKLESTDFTKILTHKKSLELRLYKEKYQSIKIGDTIEFTENVTKNPRTHTVTITTINLGPTFKNLFTREMSPYLAGYKSIEALIEGVRRFYSLEEEIQHGVVAFGFSSSKDNEL